MARLDFASTTQVETVGQGGGTDALMALGLMYCTGRDVAIDLVEAHKWFNLAAMRGNAEARRYRQELAAEMSKVDLARALKRAREWLAVH